MGRGERMGKRRERERERERERGRERGFDFLGTEMERGRYN
jgi:hypothetical protein